jgi:hypothetical protein
MGSRWRQPPESDDLSIKQHCVPEVWLHQKQAFPRFRIVGFQHIDDIVAGNIL